jgi:hypothetical protein
MQNGERMMIRNGSSASTGRPTARLVSAVALAVLLIQAVTAARTGEPAQNVPPGGDPSGRRAISPSSHFRHDPPETLWFFDADFEDLTGDNAGWQSFDMSGGNVGGDYWHKDTIRIRDFTHLGDSTWWCGRYHNWWRQARGYGNDWKQWLYREIPLSDWSEESDEVVFEWDQRFAMENDYDYGYVDFSYDYGASWTTLGIFANNGFAGQPGMSHDWDSTSPSGPGHVVEDISQFAGRDIIVRFRFESDGAYSAQDQWNNPPFNSVLDGAWQLDNFTISVNDEVVWLDDCESPGENGWIHHHAPFVGKTGVKFERAFEPDTHRGHTCSAGTGWMMAAVDSVTGLMVDYQHSLLISPPLLTAGMDGIVVQWEAWNDFQCGYWNPHVSWGIAQSDTSAGLDGQANFYGTHAIPSWPTPSRAAPEGPRWLTTTYTVPGRYLSKDWIAMGWRLGGTYPDPPEVHSAGAFLDRVRVGTFPEGPPTVWHVDAYEMWYDVFSVDEIDERPVDVGIIDDDGLAAVRTVASADSGRTWNSYEMNPYYSYNWRGYPPPDLLAPGAQILYYFEATDSLGNVSVWPAAAPDDVCEFSIVPVHGSPEDPGILVVDKRHSKTPGEDRRYTHESDCYVTEALNVLGYEYDLFDGKEDYHWCTSSYSGPREAEAYSHYDTHIWLTGDMMSSTVSYWDRNDMIIWLAGSTPESPRRLFLCGNNIGWDLVENENDTHGFFSDWLSAYYEDYHAGAYSRSDVPDTTIRVRDAGLGLMTYDDRECWLRCGCPDLQYVDVVSPVPGSGAQLALEYVNGLGEVRPAGVVKVDTLTGYRVVYLPFGIELMHDGLDGTGHYRSGLADRVDLVGNIMEFLGETPTAPGTGSDDAPVYITRLEHARPNPFNPTTTIEFSVATEGHVTIRVFDAAGRVVRTLEDGHVTAGPHTTVWDGTTDSGERVASGVYFVRMEAAGANVRHRAIGKLVLLK